MIIIFSHWNQQIQRKHLGKTQLFNFQYVTYHQGANMDFSMFSYLNIFDCLDRDKINYKILHYLKFGVFTNVQNGQYWYFANYVFPWILFVTYDVSKCEIICISNNKRITFHDCRLSWFCSFIMVQLKVGNISIL